MKASGLALLTLSAFLLMALGALAPSDLAADTFRVPRVSSRASDPRPIQARLLASRPASKGALSAAAIKGHSLSLYSASPSPLFFPLLVHGAVRSVRGWTSGQGQLGGLASAIAIR